MPFIIGALCFALAIPTRADAATGPFSMKIQFNGYNRAETLTNFPALVLFSNGMGGSSFTFANTPFLNANGYDLRFTDSSGTINLNYEIEAWTNPITQAAYVWVQVPAMSAAGYIWAKWGDPANTNQLPCTTNGATWDPTAFAAVWHMNQPNTRDSTANANNGSANGTIANATGVIDGAQAVSGGYDSVPTSASLRFGTATATISGWVYFNTLPGSESAITRVANGWALEANGSTLMRSLLQTTGTSGWTAGNDDTFNPALSTGAWYYFAFTYNGAQLCNFENGSQIGAHVVSGNTSFAPNSVGLCASGGGNGDTAGQNSLANAIVDEIRVEQVFRSTNWIWATYMTVVSNGGFNSYGSVQAGVTNYTINASAGPNGSIAPSGSVSVPSGNNQTFTITANGGYIVTNVFVDGSSLGVTNSYTFVNVTAGHIISAFFGPNGGTNYTINAGAGPNGSIVPPGAVLVPSGSNQTFTITGNSGYNVTNVVVDGSSLGATGSYTFNNVLTNHAINAYFGSTGGSTGTLPVAYAAWKNSMMIGFSGYNAPETLTNFPALVVLSTNIFGFSYNQFASTSGYDLRFSSSDGSSNLNYQIEQWTPSGSSYVWVQVPKLSSGSYIWAFWGNTNANVSGAAPVYTTNGAMWATSAFVGVWHMSQANALDSTANKNNGNANGSVINTAGLIGGAETVSGGSYVNVPDTLSLNFSTSAATISGWVRFNTLPSAEQAITRNDGEWALEANGSTLMRNLLQTTGTTGWTAGNDDPLSPSLSVGPWFYFAFTYNGAQLNNFENGALIGTHVVTGTINVSGGNPGLGGCNAGDTLANAVVDEVRVEQVCRSANWISASYLTAAANSTFETMTMTPANTPLINNASASGIAVTTATLNGNLISAGASPTTVYVFWGGSDGGTNKSSWANAVNLGIQGTGPLGDSVTGLSAGATYFYRYYATNQSGDAWAPSSTSFTDYPNAPVIQNSIPASQITSVSAQLAGNLASAGSAPTTVYVFWGTSDKGTNIKNWANTNNLGILNAGQFTTGLTGLTDQTLYYYRFFATNSFGGAWASATEQFLATHVLTLPTGLLDARQFWACSRLTPLIISEIMYNPPNTYTNDTEFIELYNTDPIDHDISGYQVSGDISYTFATGTTIRARSYLVVGTDPVFLGYLYGLNNVLGPYSGKLPNDSGTINLNNSQGASLLNIQYSSAYPWPAAADGSGHSLVLTKPDYGEGDVRAWSASAGIWGNPGTNNVTLTNTLTQVVINEFLAHTDPPEVDSIELFNNSTTAVDISGCYLSDDPTTNKFRIPNGTILTPRGFAVFYYGADFNFLLSPHAAAIYLVDPTQSYVIDAILYPAQVNGVSYGRYPDGAPGFQTLSSWTPGTSNSVPYQSDIVINEIMYAPMSGLNDDQYIELYNRGTGTVDMSYWRFTSGIDFMIPPGTLIASNGYVVVAKNATNLFAKYPNLNTANTVGDYSGNLSGSGERLALSRPDNTKLPYQDFVDVDDVTYNAGWGQWSDAGGSSLELIDPHSNNRLAMNWGDSDETHKAAWTTIDYTDSFDNGKGPADTFRVYFLNAGECLLDNVQMSTPGGATYLPLQTFESGTGSWQFWGDHVRSSIEATGYLSSASLHIRASDSGANGTVLGSHAPALDPFPNNVSFPLSSYPSTAVNVEIKAMARWLRGYPYIVLGLKGFWIEAPVKLNVPANLGTPGLPNSRYKANTGPAISEVIHTPILPSNQPVVVTCRVNDPDGVGSVTLNYRIDPSWITNTVPMLDNGTGGDAIANDGIYSATIPAEAPGTIVAFTISATDKAAPAATNCFPVPPSTTVLVPLECLVRFGDTVPPGSFASYSMWLSQTNSTLWSDICGQNSVYSDEPFDLTLACGNYRAIYNCSGRWHGLWRDGDVNPTNGGSYSINIPDAEKYLGKSDAFFKAPGQDGTDPTFQVDKMGYWMTEQMGFEAAPLRYIRLFVNGSAPVGANGQINSVMYDLVEPSGGLTGNWTGDNDPLVYKEYGIEDGDPFGLYKDAAGNYKQSRYRWYLRKKQSNLPNDDYTGLFALAAAFATTNDALYTERVQALVHTRGWLSYFAINGAMNNWDTYGFTNPHNMYTYIPAGDKARLFVFDTDWCFSGSPNSNPFPSDSTDFPIACRMSSVSQPGFRREYWNLLKDMVDGPMQAANCNPVMDAWYAAFNANGITATSPATMESWISQQRNYLISQMTSFTNAPFSIAMSDFTTNASPVTIIGTAPVQIETILINSNAYSVTWTAETGWQLSVSLTNGLNSLTFVGLDRNNNIVGQAHINVTYTGGFASPVGNLVINEIMYHPTQPNGEFVEIYNTNTVHGFDMSGMRLKGVDFTFVGGSYIGPTSYVVVAQSMAGYQAAYSNVEVVAGAYSGSLNNGGDSIKLEMPLTNTWLVLDQVNFNNNPPWPTQADGYGPSLQLIDPTKDNNRIGNWAVDTNVLYTPGRANSVATSLPAFDNLWINEIMPSNTATIKNNAGQYAPWLNLYNNGTNNVNLFSSKYYLTDNYTNLTKWAFPAGWTITNNGYQLVWCDGETNLTVSTNLHAGFVMNSYSGSVALVRVSGVSTIIVDYVNYTGIGQDQAYGYYPNGGGNGHQVFYYPTPGGANNSAWAPVTSVCINEWMANNTMTLADPADGDCDDWFELYNSSTQAVDMTGFQLAGNLNTNSLNKVPDGTTIPGHGYLLVWANAANSTTGSDLYVSFGLSQSGDKIGLYTPDGALADGVVFGPQLADVAEGRWPDGSTNIYQMPIPTPRSANRLFAISNFGQSGSNGVVFGWNTLNGHQYRVLQANSLVNPVWSNAFGSDMNATGGVFSTNLNFSGAATTLYYKIEQVWPNK